MSNLDCKTLRHCFRAYNGTLTGDFHHTHAHSNYIKAEIFELQNMKILIKHFNPFALTHPWFFKANF